MARIVFFKGKNQYNVISAHIDSDAVLLRAAGHDVEVVDDFKDPDLLTRLKAADLIVGYQGWGWEMRLSDGRLLLETLKAPFVAMLGDHPAYHLPRIKCMAAHHHVFVCSMANARFAAEILDVPGSVYLGLPTYSNPPDFTWQGRDIDILVAGSIDAPETILKAPGLDDAGRKIIRDGYRVWRQEDQGRTDTFELFLTRLGADMVEGKGFDYALSVAVLFDQYCRRSYRLEMVRKLKDFPLTLVGSGWKKLCKGLGKNFRFIETLGYEKYHALLRRSKIAINVLAPHFDFHERIVDGAANGAAVVTHHNPSVAEAYRFGEDLVALPGIDEGVADALAPLLSAPDRAEPVARAGAQTVRETYSAQNRIAAYLEILERGTATRGAAYRRYDHASGAQDRPAKVA